MNLPGPIFPNLCSIANRIRSFQFFEHTYGMVATPKIRLPGYGIALNEGAHQAIRNGDAFPNALLGVGYT